MSDSKLEFKLSEIDLCKVSISDIIYHHKFNFCIFLVVIIIICIITHLIAYYGFYKKKESNKEYFNQVNTNEQIDEHFEENNSINLQE